MTSGIGLAGVPLPEERTSSGEDDEVEEGEMVAACDVRKLLTMTALARGDH